jgi:beta-lactamase class A
VRALRTLQRWWVAAAALVAAAAVVVAFAAGAFSTPRPARSPRGVPAAAHGPVPPAPAPAAQPARPDPPPRRAPGRGVAASFHELQSHLPGRVQVAVLPLAGGPETRLGGDDPAHGWSTTKVPVLVALLRARGAAGLTPAEREAARLAITASDNQAILDLFAHLAAISGGSASASAAVQDRLRASGDNETIVATAPPPPGAVTPFGQTEWAPGAAVKFFRALALGRLLPAAQTADVLRLMGEIVPGERWGLGSGGFTVPVVFKGGWGPEPSGRYLVRQSGIVDPRSRHGVAVAIVAYPPAGHGSFDTGQEMVTRTAAWLRAELPKFAPR